MSAESSAYFDEVLGKSSQVKVYVPQGSYYFFSHIVEKGKNGKFYIKFPEALFLKERRSHSREYRLENLKVNLSFRGQLLRKNCYDIGQGGFSVILNKMEKINFIEGEDLDFADFLLMDIKLKFQAVVSQIIEIRPFIFEHIPYGQKKVSFEFKKMSKDKLLLLESMLEEIKSTYSVK